MSEDQFDEKVTLACFITMAVIMLLQTNVIL